MAFDGAFLNQVCHEIAETALQARVDRIHQPSREELIMVLRHRNGNSRLLLSAGANSPRIHFTTTAPENPKTPPMFCMLLRKHLGNAKLREIRQQGLDRVVFLVFDSQNDFGDAISFTLAVEIMGRHSNIILIDQNGRIIDSIKRVDAAMSGVRQVLPGLSYTLPPAQDKRNLLEHTSQEIIERMWQTARPTELSKLLTQTLQGFSPLLAREIAHYVGRGQELAFTDLTQEGIARLEFSLSQLAKTMREHTGTPCMVLDLNGRPKDLSFVEIHQYGSAMLTKTFKSYGELLDHFYSDRDGMERMKQRSHDLLKTLANSSDRLTRKMAAQREELLACAQREELKKKGELLSAYLYQLQKGQSSVSLPDFYSEQGAMVEIALDPSLTPTQNVQRYYSEYRKADTAERMLTGLLAEEEKELSYLDSVFDLLTRSRTESELDAIKEELAEQGYIKRFHLKRKKPEKLPPLRYRSSDGFLILAGRNNLQNDRLTLKESSGADIWLHTQKIHGSHVIVVSEGKPVPDSTLEEAAIVAAYNSKARESAQVAVDYTAVKNVKKPSGAKPGMVIYDRYQTAFVTPDPDLVARLLENSKQR